MFILACFPQIDTDSCGSMASGNSYFEDMRIKSEVIDPPQSEYMMDVVENVNDSAQNISKPNAIVTSSVRDLLECPVCLNAMYPPIHQVRFIIVLLFFFLKFLKI